METIVHGIDITSSALFGMRARSCHCHVADTDNNGMCYTCGGYIASRDAGRYI